MELDGGQSLHSVLFNKPRAGRAGEIQVPPVDQVTVGSLPSTRLEADTLDDVVVLQHLKHPDLRLLLLHIEEKCQVPRVEILGGSFPLSVAEIIVVAEKEKY